jgi:hypothetical protein
LALWAEPDLDFNLSRTPEHPRATQVDYRVLLTEYLGWESASRRGFSDLNASAGYYSRYHDNVIGYLQARGGVGFWRADGFTLNAYVPVTVVKDANRDFFNNLAEGGAGLELRPKAGISFNIRAEFVHGVYFGIHGTDPNPYGRQYDDFRILFIIGSHTPLME